MCVCLCATAACVFVALGNFVASLCCVSAFSKDVFISPGGKEEEDEEEEVEGEEVGEENITPGERTNIWSGKQSW